jgi:hypothetical protein
VKARLVLVCALALAAPGCGGGSKAAESAAGLVPATAQVFVSLDTDLHSDQVKSADAVLKKFPIRGTVLKQIRSQLESAGVRYAALKGSLGPRVDVAVLDVDSGETVAFTQPTDEKAFEQAVQSSGDTKVVFARIHGWTAFSDKQDALDQVKHADEKLADAALYKDATAKLPDEALATAYAAGAAVRQGVSTLGSQASAASSFGIDSARWVSAALTSHDDGVELQLHVNTKRGAGKNFESTLADEIPSGALAAISFSNAGSVISQLESAQIPGLDQVEQALGTSLKQIAQALEGEGIIYARRGNPIPEVTLVAKEDDEKAAKHTADAIVRSLTQGAGKTSTTTVDGVKLTAVDLGSVSLFYGTFDGKLLVSDNANAVRETKGGGDKLTDDKLFKDATGAVGMPDQTNGWLYLDFKDGVPLVEGFAQLSGTQIPLSIDENLRPLRSLVAYTVRDGNTQTVEVFVQTS